MLPYRPLHCLPSDAFERPSVMTSGNRSGSAKVLRNGEALTEIAAVADAFLLHDREIARRLDDGVVRMELRGLVTLRRGRGQASGTPALPKDFGDSPQVVAYGTI